jgi:tRNA (mo5U34)-methyltransferase
MATTRPRTFRIGGVEVAVKLDRDLAEKVKATPVYRMLRGAPPPAFRDGEPVVDGLKLTDIEWYHTIELGNGVVTPGFVDHRPHLHLFPLPASLAGKRCLDVATADGFWAFEMERRGAAEVVATDVYSRHDCDFPTNFWQEYFNAMPNEVKGRAFAFAKRALRSRARRQLVNVYELSPERVGTFDFVFMSDILLHLRDPLKAVEAVWTVVRPGGRIILAEPYDTELEDSGLQNITRFMVSPDTYAGAMWWRFTTSYLKWLMLASRFVDVEEAGRYEMESKLGRLPKVIFTARRDT